MNRIGILGGSFDPPHFGHLELAKAALQRFGFENLLLLLTPIPPHKKHKKLTPFASRQKMLELLIENEPKLEICTIENERQGPHYIFDTIKLLKQVYPNAEFWFIIGSDVLNSLHTWYRIDELVKQIQFCVALRPGFEFCETNELNSIASIESIEKIRETIVPMPLNEISSSEIQKNIKAGKNIENLTLDKIISFIKANKLYI